MTETIVLILPLIWTVCCGISLAMGIWALQDAWEDLAAKRAAGINGAIEIIGRASIRREAGRIYVQFVFVTIGVLALLAPRFPDSLPMIVIRSVSTVGFVSVAISMAVDRLLDRRARIQITRILRGPATDPKRVVKGV